jgi:hypothetical protein
MQRRDSRLIRSNCDLKICDFGLARLEEETSLSTMTVRAPRTAPARRAPRCAVPRCPQARAARLIFAAPLGCVRTCAAPFAPHGPP